MSTYSARNAMLKRMGYDSYADYLASDLWVQVRARAEELHGNKCKVCNREARCYHHISYDREVILGEDVSLVVPMCLRCHKKVEFTPSKQKRSLVEAREAYSQLIKSTTKLREKRLAKNLPPEQRKGIGGYCAGCGFRAKKGSRYCRKCNRGRMK